MTRAQFMQELRERLDRLSPAEKNAALSYYEEYFDEAGSDREQEVIRELGSPASVASRILADHAIKAARQAPYNPGKGLSAIWFVLLAIIAGPSGYLRPVRHRSRHSRLGLCGRSRGRRPYHRRCGSFCWRFFRPVRNARHRPDSFRRGLSAMGHRKDHIRDYRCSALDFQHACFLAFRPFKRGLSWVTIIGGGA
jgi:hypothetical protein